MSGNLYNNDRISGYLKGDYDPAEFDWNELLVPSEYLTLLKRNGKIRKACSWVAREAIRPRFILKKDKKIVGTKHGKPYTFDNIQEYLEWIGFFSTLESCLTWARLFGTAIIVLFKEGEGDKKEYEPLSEYDTCQAYYPIARESGYTIVQSGNSWYYQIQFVNILGNTETFKVHKDRVIPFNAPHLELKYEGNSEVEALAKIAIIQEQMFRSLIKRIHEMGAGTAVIKVADSTEKEIIDASIKDSLKYTSKIYTTGDVEEALKMFVPDLNSQQFREIWEIAQEEIANNMNMSKKLISGDPQGAVSSAKWDTEISYTEVYQTQRHYKKPIEHVLFMLGIEDTTFQWNDPFPTEQSDDTNNKGENENVRKSNSRRDESDRANIEHESDNSTD
jgi:hypothetical protein